MARWIGLAFDPTPGGTTYDQINDRSVAIPDPELWIPATTATASAGSNNLNRNNEVRGRRGNTAPIAFNAAPTASFEVRAYPAIVRAVVAAGLGRIGTPRGTSPAAITTTVSSLDSNPIPTLALHLLREEQYEVVAGLAVDRFELNFAADAEGTVQLSEGRGLYYDVAQSLPDPLPRPDYRNVSGETFKIRDLVAYMGDGEGIRVDCLNQLSLSFDNAFIDDFQSRYCAGENVRSYVYEGRTYKVWLPGRHRVGPQAITGTMGFAEARPDLELRRILSHATKFRAVLTAGAIEPATTPARDETMEIVIHQQVLTGGGADPLQKDGDIRSSYEFGGFLDPATNEDLDISFTTGEPIDPWTTGS